MEKYLRAEQADPRNGLGPYWFVMTGGQSKMFQPQNPPRSLRSTMIFWEVSKRRLRLPDRPLRGGQIAPRLLDLRQFLGDRFWDDFPGKNMCLVMLKKHTIHTALSEKNRFLFSELLLHS